MFSFNLAYCTDCSCVCYRPMYARMCMVIIIHIGMSFIGLHVKYMSFCIFDRPKVVWLLNSSSTTKMPATAVGRVRGVCLYTVLSFVSCFQELRRGSSGSCRLANFLACSGNGSVARSTERTDFFFRSSTFYRFLHRHVVSILSYF